MTEFEGFAFDELPSEMQRRIRETDVVIYQIREGTPEAVRYEIFNRINTGGTPLSSQEIRHALHPGVFLNFLDRLAHSKDFTTATGESISSTRMVDRECVLRFMAFTFLPPELYPKDDFNFFLHKAMDVGNRLSPQKMDEYERRFYRAMKATHRIFGAKAFRKYYKATKNRPPISRSLFDAISVNLDILTDEQIEVLVRRKKLANEKMVKLFEDDKEFGNAISQGSSSGARYLRYRFEAIRLMFEGILNQYSWA